MKKSNLVILVGAAIITLVTVIFLCIHLSPIFTYCIIVVFLLSLGFVMTEGMITHNAAEYENRFWSVMAFFFACACVFAPDSPINLTLGNQAHLGIAIPIVLLFTYLIHIYDRHLRRIVLSKVPNMMKRIRSVDFGTMESRMNAQEKLNMLRIHLDNIDHRWLSSTFQNIFLLPSVLHIERSIVAIFREVPDDELNYIIKKAQLGRIFYKIKDHFFARCPHRSMLLELLSIERIKQLNLHSKVMLLHAFQVMKLSAHSLSGTYVRSIIRNTKYDELSELKCITDSKGDINSMHKLIFEDIKDKSIRQDILEYILAQAKIQEGFSVVGGRIGKRRQRLAWRKIVSDVDDTLTSSGGSYPAGVDKSYPKKSLYPGVLAFYRELDLGTKGDEEWNDTLNGNLVFLSARPHIYKDISETVTYDKFVDLQKKRGLYTSPTLLAGSLNTGSQFILKDDFEPLAVNKYSNLTQYLTIYPEFSCVMVGDNGQGDVRAAEMMCENPIHSKQMSRVYIHQVMPLSETYTKDAKVRTPYNKKKHQQQPGQTRDKICYFKTYVDAAVDAYNNQLIRLSSLRRVMEASLADFEFITQADWKKCENVAANTQTQTAPKNLVNKSNSTLHNSTGSIRSSSSLSLSAPAKPIKTEKLLSNQLIPESQYEINLREINNSLREANVLLVQGGLPPTRLLRVIQKHVVGSAVVTPYGKAVVTRFRPTDGVYEVLMQWDGSGQMKPVKGFFQACSLLPIPSPSLSNSSVASKNVGNIDSFNVSSAANIAKNIPAPTPLKNELASSALQSYRLGYMASHAIAAVTATMKKHLPSAASSSSLPTSSAPVPVPVSVSVVAQSNVIPGSPVMSPEMTRPRSSSMSMASRVLGTALTFFSPATKVKEEIKDMIHVTEEETIEKEIVAIQSISDENGVLKENKEEDIEFVVKNILENLVSRIEESDLQKQLLVPTSSVPSKTLSSLSISEFTTQAMYALNPLNLIQIPQRSGQPLERSKSLDGPPPTSNTSTTISTATSTTTSTSFSGFTMNAFNPMNLIQPSPGQPLVRTNSFDTVNTNVSNNTLNTVNTNVSGNSAITLNSLSTGPKLDTISTDKSKSFLESSPVPSILNIFKKASLVSTSSSTSSPQNVPKMNLGGIYWTPYGLGVPVGYRRSDDVFVIAVPSDFSACTKISEELLNSEKKLQEHMSSNASLASNDITRTTLASETVCDSNSNNSSNTNNIVSKKISEMKEIREPCLTIFTPRLNVVQLTLPHLTRSTRVSSVSSFSKTQSCTTPINSLLCDKVENEQVFIVSVKGQTDEDNDGIDDEESVDDGELEMLVREDENNKQFVNQPEKVID